MDARFNVLGSLDVTVDGVDATPATPKERNLLALLILSHGQIVSADRLIEELWPELEPDRARPSLHVRIAAIRKALGRAAPGAGALVQSAGPGYRLDATPSMIDAEQFHRLVREARFHRDGSDPPIAAAALGAALALWRGDPLADAHESVELEAAAVRLAEARLDAVEDWADAELACGRHGAVLAEVASLADAHPWRERLWRQRMTCLYQAGRQADALAVGQALRHRLVEELGLDPSHELLELERAILGHAEHLAAPVTPALARAPAWPAQGALSGPPGEHERLDGWSFLFTDLQIVRLARDGPITATRVRAEDPELRAVIEAHDGRVFAAGGRSVAAAFADPLAAVRAAEDARSRLGRHGRLAVHTGTAVVRDGHCYGPTVSHGIRIMAAGHAGQILLTEVTAALVRELVPLVDLGEHHLSGLSAPVRVWQVGAEVHPPLKTTTASRGNLSAGLDSFVGRAAEVARLWELMGVHRLVTVVGPAGMGKTRLVTEAAARADIAMAGGVWFVDLRLVRPDQAVVGEVAAAMNLQPSLGQSVEDRVLEYLEARPTMLLFDNCEHVVDAAAALIERLLLAAPALRVVATSREALRVRGEQVMPLGPLPITGGAAGGGDAVVLFVDRVRSERGEFDPSATEIAAAAEICRHLDGMPLAIELAAARARSLGTAQVLDRLDERLRLLSEGRRSGAGRQQTLQATLDWSYALLDEQEQRVFDRLGVFVGSFTIDDAAAVAADDGVTAIDVIDAVSALADQSMCVVDAEHIPSRYRYLETMRVYARDHLDRSGAVTDADGRHAQHFAQMAARAAEALEGPDEVSAAADLRDRAPDLHSALIWSSDHGAASAIDLIGVAAYGLADRGAFDMCSWCYELHDRLTHSTSACLAASHYALFALGDIDKTEQLAEELLGSGNPDADLAWFSLGWVSIHRGDFEEAIARHQRFYDYTETRSNPSAYVYGANTLATTLVIAGQDPGRHPQAIIDRATVMEWTTGIAKGHSLAAITPGADPTASLEAFDRALAAATVAENEFQEAIILRARFHTQARVLPPARLAGEMVSLLRRIEQMGWKYLIDGALDFAAQLLASAGRSEAATVIWGWWLEGRGEFGSRHDDRVGEAMAAAQAALGDAWPLLLARGHALTLDQLTDYACAQLTAISAIVDGGQAGDRG